MSYVDAMELREKHNKLIRDSQTLLDEAESGGRLVDGDLGSEDRERWQSMMDAAKELRTRISAAEEREKAQAEMRAFASQSGAPVIGDASFRGTDANGQDEKLPTDPAERSRLERSAFSKRLKNMVLTAFDEPFRHELSDVERRLIVPTGNRYPEYRAGQQSVGTSSAGGVLVPEGFQREIIRAMKAYGGMRQVARVLNTASGNNLPIPISDDTGNAAVIVSEASTTSGGTALSYGLVTLEAAKYQTGPSKVSLELAQDSAFDMAAEIETAFATRFGRGTEAHFATRSSTEAAGPHGIINDSTGAVTIATGSSNFSFDSLKDLWHSVDPAYRASPQFAWQFNDNTLSIIAKLKDSTNQYLWQPGLQGPNPNAILGTRFVINQDFQSFDQTSATKPIFLGDWRHYVIRDVMPITTFRLTERYIEEGNFGFIGFARFDGRATFGSTTPARKPIRCILNTT